MRTLTHCPICSCDEIGAAYAAPSSRTPTDGTSWTVFRCGACSHGFMNPQPTFDELAPYYSADYEAYDARHGSESDDEETLAAARKAGEFRHLPIPQGKRLLDVGCGGGWFLSIARRLGAEVMGVEPSSHGAARATASGLPVFNGTLEDFVATGVAAAKIDIITSNHVIEHVPDPSATLALMRSLLVSGGMIWIAVPNPTGHFGRTLGNAWHSADLPFHIHQFTPKSLALAGQRAGLKVSRIYTYSLPSASAASLRLVLRRRYWIPQRLSARLRLLNEGIAARMARRLDGADDGEAIIAEFTQAA